MDFDFLIVYFEQQLLSIRNSFNMIGNDLYHLRGLEVLGFGFRVWIVEQSIHYLPVFSQDSAVCQGKILR